MNNLIDAARHIPVNEAVPTVSVSPVTLSAPDRGLPLELRITAPAGGRDLPIILLSHGHGPSLTSRRRTATARWRASMPSTASS